MLYKMSYTEQDYYRMYKRYKRKYREELHRQQSELDDVHTGGMMSRLKNVANAARINTADAFAKKTAVVKKLGMEAKSKLTEVAANGLLISLGKTVEAALSFLELIKKVDKTAAEYKYIYTNYGLVNMFRAMGDTGEQIAGQSPAFWKMKADFKDVPHLKYEEIAKAANLDVVEDNQDDSTYFKLFKELSEARLYAYTTVRDYDAMAEILFTHNYQQFLPDDQKNNIVRYMAATDDGWNNFIEITGNWRATWEQMEHLISTYWRRPEKEAEAAKAKQTFEEFQKELGILYRKLPDREADWDESFHTELRTFNEKWRHVISTNIAMNQ